MRKISQKLLLLIVMFSIVFTMTGCGTNKEIKNLMVKFEQACNANDINAVLECVNPKTVEKIKTAFDVTKVLTRIDLKTAANLLVNFLSSDIIGGGEVLSSVDIKVKKIEAEDTKAKVTTLIKYDVKGEEKEKKAIFKCVNVDEKWYISSFSFEK